MGDDLGKRMRQSKERARSARVYRQQRPGQGCVVLVLGGVAGTVGLTYGAFEVVRAVLGG